MKAYNLLILFLLLTLFTSCIEEIDFETENFESALVIEATITNEIKNQEVLLSRTYQFEEDGPNPENNAVVTIEAGNTVYNFVEIEPGKYVSINTFNAVENVEYHLKITTNNGRHYTSTPTYLTQSTQIDELYAVRETNDDGINGMSIYIDSYDPTGNSKYYRYVYEETFKIVAPFWKPQKLEVVNNQFPLCAVEVVNRTEEERVCYSTDVSNTINLATTNSLDEDRVTRHLVRFINRDNYIISYRYSILAHQYIQSREAYTYFETLQNISGDESLFSQNQPGFFNGNVFSETNSEEKVIGFFDVSTVSSERIYFNYEDFYPDEEIPPYFISCYPYAPDLITLNNSCGNLIWHTQENKIKYYEENNGQLDGGPYIVVIRECGDCTAIGNNYPPEFWVD